MQALTRDVTADVQYGDGRLDFADETVRAKINVNWASWRKRRAARTVPLLSPQVRHRRVYIGCGYARPQIYAMTTSNLNCRQCARFGNVLW